MSFNVNFYLNQLGGFGKYQLYVYVLSLIPAFIAGMVALQNVFIMGMPKHRCYIENCDTSQFYSAATDFARHAFLNETIPNGADCEMFKTWPSNDSASHCYGNVDTSRTVGCEKFAFDESEFGATVIRKFDLICDSSWQRTVSSSIFMSGNLFGAVIFGFSADKFGRKSVFYWGPVVGLVASLSLLVSPNVALFSFANMIVAGTSIGLYLCGFILGVELIGEKWGIWCANGYQMAFAMGEVLLALIAYRLRDWVHLEMVVATFLGSQLLFIL